MLGTVDQLGHDERGKSFTIGHNGICRLRRHVLNETHAVENASQFGEERIEVGYEACLLFVDNHVGHHLMVAFGDGVEFGEVGHVACCCHAGGTEQLVGHTAQSRNDHNDGVLRFFNDAFEIEYGGDGAHGGTAEFEYFH